MVDSPTLLGRYRLEERLASGGMGAVWAATDERLGRRVAIKMLKDQLAEDPRFVERFRREARAVAALSHPHIANVYDYGEDGGNHFIVMELAEGRDLARILASEGPIDPSRTGSIGARICDALASAHRAGVVHRDIKPANVIIGAGDRVKVTDFGIARAAGDSTLTATGAMIGTAGYISPEQASGTPVGPLSDIYSLGIVLYEMLTGAPPFVGDSPLSIAMQHVQSEIPSPSRVNPEVPADLDEIVARATAKEPEDRFPSADDIANALRGATDPSATAVMPGAAVGGAPQETRPLTREEPPEPRTRERPVGTPRRRSVTPLVIAALIGLVLLAGVLILPRLSDEAPPATGTGRDAGGGGGNPGGGSPVYELKSQVIGAPYQEVEAVLEDQGFAVEIQTIDSSEAADTIVETDPPPGTPLDAGQTITLVVAGG
jgi:eukaryotic-like serine/threonine-protein kinase